MGRGVVPDGGTCVAERVAVVVEDGAGVAWCGVGVTAGTPLSATRAARSATNEARARPVLLLLQASRLSLIHGC